MNTHARTCAHTLHPCFCSRGSCPSGRLPTHPSEPRAGSQSGRLPLQVQPWRPGSLRAGGGEAWEQTGGAPGLLTARGLCCPYSAAPTPPGEARASSCPGPGGGRSEHPLCSDCIQVAPHTPHPHTATDTHTVSGTAPAPSSQMLRHSSPHLGCCPLLPSSPISKDQVQAQPWHGRSLPGPGAREQPGAGSREPGAEQG